MVKLVNGLSEFEELVKSSKLTIVDCFAEWCGPCKAIAPYLEELAKDFPDVQFLKVDVDEAVDISNKLGISAMPTFKFFKNGEVVDELVGASKSELKSKLEKNK